MPSMTSSERAAPPSYATLSQGPGEACLLSGGEPLHELERRARAGLAGARGSRPPTTAIRSAVQLALVRMLMGRTQPFGSLSETGLDEHEAEPRPDPATDDFCHSVGRLQASYYARDFAQAVQAAESARALVGTCDNLEEEAELWFFGALAETACVRDDGAARSLESVDLYQRRLASWAVRRPTSFTNKLRLVEAERARVEKRTEDAARLYEESIVLAREQGYVHEQALAYERYADAFSARGLSLAASSCSRSARSCYESWGALAKVRQLDELARASEPGHAAGAWRHDGGSRARLELSMLARAVRSISVPNDLDQVLDALMTSSLQLALAERSALVLRRPEPRIHAVALTRHSGARVERRDAVHDPRALPVSLCEHVLRTGSSVVWQETAPVSPFLLEPYFEGRLVASLVCLPIVFETEVSGALYLENVAEGALTDQGLALLELLSFQAASSLERARLGAELHQAKLVRSHAERVSRTGSFRAKPSVGEIHWSEEVSRIYQIDGTPTLELQRQRIHPEDRALFESVMAEPQRFDSQVIEHRLLLPDGSVRYLSVIAAQLEGRPDEPPEFVGAVRDVTDAKRAEETLERALIALTDVTRVVNLGEMAAAIAHEVNQPLAAIGLNASSCARWLGERQLNLAEARAALQRIARDSLRAGQNVSRLRALFAKTGGARGAVDLNDATREVVALLRARLRASGASLQLDLADDLPSVYADRVQLQQVIMNLLVNACEAMAGGVREITLRSRAVDPGRVGLEVRDSGCGVGPLDLPRIFEPFFTTKPQGMGMGLAVSRTILEGHGGDISARSNADGPGTTLLLRLPMLEMK